MKRILLNILLLSFYYACNAQIDFKHYGVEDGFSDISVRRIIQDNRGYLWMGTLNGLNRYDGKSVKVYRKEAGNPYSLGYNRIAQLYQDSYNYIWILTYDRGIYRFDIETERFENFGEKIEEEVGKKNISHNIFESSPGVVWIYSRVSGVTRIIENPYNQKCEIDHFDSENILPNNLVRFVFKDRENSIWIGTGNGLTKFPNDTVTSVSPKIIQYKEGVFNTEFKCVSEVGDKLWFGTHDQGLFYYSYLTRSITRWNKIDLSIPIPAITKGVNNDFLVSTQGKGLVYFKNADLEYIHLQTGKYKQAVIEDEYYLTYRDNENIFWIESRKRGITMFDPFKLEVKHYSLNGNYRESNGEPDNPIFHEDSNGDLWIGIYGGGLCRLDRDKMEFEQFFHISDNPNSLSSNYVVTIFEDDGQNLWLGTYQGGVNKIELNKYPFNFKTPVKKSNFQSSNEVRALMVDKFNRTWISTKKGLIYCYDKDGKEIIRLPEDIGLNKRYFKGNVYELEEDNQGNLWVGTKGYGLYIIKGILKDVKLEKKSYQILNYQQNYQNSSDPFSLSSNDVYAMHQDIYGQMWIGTYRGGICLVKNINDIKFEVLRHDPNDSTSVSHDMVRCIYEDSQKNLWIGTINGISLLERKYLNQDQKKFQVIKGNNQDTASLISNDVITIIEDHKKRIWAGTYGGGIGIITPDSINNSFSNRNILLKDGLPSEVVVSLVSDHNGNIWAGTDNGLCRIDYNNKKVETYNKEEGLGDYFFTENTGVTTKDKRLLFGMKRGFVTFHPDSVKKDTSLYRLWITGIKILNKELKVSENGPLYQSIERTEKIELKHYQNFISVEFTLLDYFNSERCQYKYKMMGVDKDWIFSGNENTAVYTDLDPGIYEFIVQAGNHDGYWAKSAQKRIQIIIKPPYYETILFKVLTVLFTLLIIIASYLYRVSNLKNQKVLLERQVKERTQQIEDKNKTLTAQKDELNNKNKLLAERQKYIENQAKELLSQKEKLETINESLNNTNTQLEERQQQVEEQSEELRSQAEELNIRNEALIATNATKDKLFSIIAHDLKNPFSSIMGFCRIILTKQKTITLDKVLHLVNVIFGSTKNIYTLLENLLEWSRTQSGTIEYKPENILLYDIVSENGLLIKDLLFDKNIVFVNKIDKNVQVYADKNMLNAVFRNLLTNALKFTEKGIIEVHANQKGSKVLVEVVDSGVGMSESIIEKIFRVDKSKSVNGTRGEMGSGLGLIICKEFIEKNDGKIIVESTEGEGTKIKFDLLVSH